MELTQQMEWRKDSWENVIRCTLSEKELDVVFYKGYGFQEGADFYLWTKSYVYTNGEYDGSEYVISLPRNPEDA